MRVRVRVVVIMKTKIAMIAVTVLAAASFLLVRPVVAQPVLGKQAAMEFPLDLEVVVTLEQQTWMGAQEPRPKPTSGLREDFTIQGKMVYFGESWVVVREGTFDTWISRDKILAVRASR